MISKEYCNSFLGGDISKCGFSFEDAFTELPLSEFKFNMCDGYGNHFIIKSPKGDNLVAFVVSSSTRPFSFVMLHMELDKLMQLTPEDFLLETAQMAVIK